MKKLLLSISLLLCLAGLAESAYADPVTYTVVLEDAFAGTKFTYVSQSGFLSFSSSVLTPSSATDVLVNSVDKGLLTGFEFLNANSFSIFSAGYSGTFNVSSYSLSAFGLQKIYLPQTELANLTITPGNILTPEPASIELLGTAMLGMAAMRRRYLGRAKP